MADGLKNAVIKHRNESYGGVEESTDKARILYSAEPLPDKIKKIRKAFYIILAAAVVSGLIFAASGLLSGIFVLSFFAFIIITSIDDINSKANLKALRTKKFMGSPQMNSDSFFRDMQPSMTRLNAKMDTAKNGCPSIEFRGYRYDVILNEDGTFCLWWRTKSVFSEKNLFGRYRLYKANIANIAVLAYEIQSVYGINAGKNQGAVGNQ